MAMAIDRPMLDQSEKRPPTPSSNAKQQPARNTALPAMLWGIEAHAALPIALWLVHIRWSTVWLVVGIVAGLTVIRYFGLDARSAYRLVGTFLIRALAGGHVRAAPAYWERRS